MDLRELIDQAKARDPTNIDHAMTSVARLSAMELPQCDRPDVSQRVNQHAAKHYVENPGRIKRPDVAFSHIRFWTHRPRALIRYVTRFVTSTSKMP
jgi:hypothetical protein